MPNTTRQRLTDLQEAQRLLMTRGPPIIATRHKTRPNSEVGNWGHAVHYTTEAEAKVGIRTRVPPVRCIRRVPCSESEGEDSGWYRRYALPSPVSSSPLPSLLSDAGNSHLTARPSVDRVVKPTAENHMTKEKAGPSLLQCATKAHEKK
jgi:hypothetical protein